MKAKNATTHAVIENTLNVYKRERSGIWQCAFKIDKKWQRQSTNTRDLKEAKERAHEILLEAKVRKKNNLAPIRRYFKSVAEATIRRMEKELERTDDVRGIKQYAEYIKIIKNYLIPVLGRYYVDSIDYKKLEILDAQRIKKMKKTPTRSTMLNHNSALNHVFDEAIYRGYMTEGVRPKLVARGKASEKRVGFTLDEVRALMRNFDAWIERGRTDSKELRALLRDYVAVLLDTGARPGKELLNLRWIEVEFTYKPQITKLDKKLIDEEGEETDTWIKANPNVHLSIAQAKTKSRIANGYVETVKALRRIAERNYGKTLQEMLDSKNKDYIFRYKDFISDRQKNSDRNAKLKKPTSFSKLFDTYLKQHNLLIDPITNQKRVLYSLRHTYASFQILYQNQNLDMLAKQMGTSIAMIDKFYSDITPKTAVNQLRGDKIYELINADVKVNKEYEYKEN
jgi:integrase